MMIRQRVGLQRARALSCGSIRIRATDGSGARKAAELRLPPELRSIAYVPQNYGLFPHLTIAEHLDFPIGAAPGATQHWLERVGLFDLRTGSRQHCHSASSRGWRWRAP